MGRTLGFFESFPFLRMGSRPWAFVGSTVLSGVCVLKSGLSTPIRVSLIVVPDKHEVCRKGKKKRSRPTVYAPLHMRFQRKPDQDLHCASHQVIMSLLVICQ